MQIITVRTWRFRTADILGFCILLIAFSVTPARAGLCNEARTTNVSSWGAPRNGLELGIGFESNSASAGSPLMLYVDIRNGGSKAVSIHRIGSYQEYSFNLTDEADVAIAASAQPGLVAQFSNPNAGIEPGSCYERHYDLTKLYDLNRPGLYHLQLVTVVHASDLRSVLANLTSNVLTFRIVPRKVP